MAFSREFVWCVLIFIVGAAAARSASPRQQPSRPAAADTSAYKGAIVIDAATGDVLFEDRADAVNPPASMTKLMTFAVLHDRLASGALALHTPVKIDTSDARMGGTQVFLDARETFTVEELIYAMMIQSANDAAHALARASAGSVPAFVELMNAKAQVLDLTNTKFRTPHGLPPSSRKVADGDLTTPRDFAQLSRHVIQHTRVLEYSSIVSRPFGAGIRAQPMAMRNHNKLLGKVDGVDGLKTGFTAAAGYCLSATAARNGRRVIVVIMGALGPNGQRDLGRARDMKAIELLERGFAALPPGPVGPVAAAKSASESPLRAAPISAAPQKAPTPANTPAAGHVEPVIKFSLPQR